MKAAQEPGHLRRLIECVGSESDRGACELVSKISVGETVQRMLAAKQRLEGDGVVARAG